MAVDGDAKKDCGRSPIYDSGEVFLYGIWDFKLFPAELKYEKKTSAICAESWVVIPKISISLRDPFLLLLRKVKLFGTSQYFQSPE